MFSSPWRWPKVSFDLDYIQLRQLRTGEVGLVSLQGMFGSCCRDIAHRKGSVLHHTPINSKGASIPFV
jgi:hypothetical protein